MKQNKNSKYYVPSSIQLLFIGIVGGLFSLQFFTLLWQGFSQYQQNPNVGGFYGFFYVMDVLPLLLFLIAYALNPRKLSITEKTFESILLATGGAIAWSLFSTIPPTIFLSDGPDYIESYATYQIAASTALALVFAGVLYWLRASKRWQ